MNESIPRWPVVVLRIYAGVMFVGAAAAGLGQSGRLWGSTFELIVGLALVFGGATPLAALIGVGVVAASMMPIHGVAVLVSPGPKTALAMVLVTVVLTRAGRSFGLDAFLARKKPDSYLW